jgi:hypothetical protein
MDPLLTQLAGDWDIVGTIMGEAARYFGEARWALNGGWLCLRTAI